MVAPEVLGSGSFLGIGIGGKWLNANNFWGCQELIDGSDFQQRTEFGGVIKYWNVLA
jgi:hypothetical protein